MRKLMLMLLIASSALPLVNAEGSDDTDIIITSDEVYAGDITIDKNLIIKDGGRLIIENATLNMNCESDGQYRILIEKGGELVVENSSITGLPEKTFRFEVYGTLRILNSEISYLWGNTSGENFIGGIQIYSDDVSIIESRLSDSKTRGIYIDSASPLIRANTIVNNGQVGIYLSNSSGIIENNIISSNGLVGIFSAYSEAMIRNNTIYSILEEGSCDTGGCSSPNTSIGVRAFLSSLTLDNNTIYDMDIGIEMLGSNGTLKGNTIYDAKDIGVSINYGVVNVSENIIHNCSLGIYQSNSETTILSNEITENIVAVHSYVSSGILENNLVSENEIGIFLINSSVPILNNTIASNEVGIECRLYSNATIERNRIFNNLQCGINSTLSFIKVRDNIIEGNGYGILLSGENGVSENNEFNNNSNGDILQQWFLSVKVKDANGKPLKDAEVTIKDAYGDWQSMRTNSAGKSLFTCIESVMNDTGKKIFNPYTIVAERNNIKGAKTINIERNDEVEMSLDLRPDLKVSEITLKSELKPGKPVFIYAKLSNDGLVDADVEVKIYLDDALLSERVVRIDAESSVNISALWTVEEGEHEIKVLIDEESKVIETDESNNMGVKRLRVNGNEIPVTSFPLILITVVITLIIIGELILRR